MEIRRQEYMQSSGRAIEVAGVLFQRIEILESLSESPKDKRELVEALDLSRSTIDRAIRNLESANVVGYEDGRFVLTNCGKIEVEATFEFVKKIRKVRQFEAFLSWIPLGELDLDIRALGEATLYTAQPGDPYAMINRHVECLRQMDHFECILPYAGLHAGEVAHEACIENGATGKLVLSPAVTETFASVEFTNVMEEIRSSDGVEFYVGRELPFALAIVDDVVQIFADREGEPVAMVESTSTEVREWAHEKFETHVQRASRL